VRVGKTNAEVLDSIAPGVFDHEIDSDRLNDFLDDHNHVLFVAVIDGVVVGQIRALVCRHPDKPRELYIDDLGVSEAFRRQGIASQLIDQEIGFGSMHSCNELFLITAKKNSGARALYRSLALTEEATTMYYGSVSPCDD
jgi:aminoglycoside 6'-N-acetyltransferase I